MNTTSTPNSPSLLLSYSTPFLPKKKNENKNTLTETVKNEKPSWIFAAMTQCLVVFVCLDVIECKMSSREIESRLMFIN